MASVLSLDDANALLGTTAPAGSPSAAPAARAISLDDANKLLAPPAPSPPTATNALANAVETVESGGNPNAVSPRGAVGPMQTMPSTLAQPGFGVTPARNNGPAEEGRVGRDYLDAMLRRYKGDVDKALAAYNAGPATVDHAISAAGPSGDYKAFLPHETRAYIQKVKNAIAPAASPAISPSPERAQAAPSRPYAATEGTRPYERGAIGRALVGAERTAGETGTAIGAGAQQGLRDVILSGAQTGQMLHGETPTTTPPVPPAQRSLAAPLNLSPGIPNLPKIGYHVSRGLTSSAPEMVGGIVGGAAGTIAAGGPESPAAVIGAPVGAGLGAGAVNAARSIAPYYAETLKKYPNDHEKAFDEALKMAGASGAVTAASFALFGIKPFASTVKNLLFQAFGVQPAASAAGQAAQNVVAGRPAGENVGQAAFEAVPGTAIPLAAEHIAGRIANLARRPTAPPGGAQEAPEAPAPSPTPEPPIAPAPPVTGPVPRGPEVVVTPEGGSFQPAGPAEAPNVQRVFTPRGSAVDVRPEVIDASKLTTSHTPDLTVNPAYPAELQPRERTRAASKEQIANMAANLRPELLGGSADATTGAPIVGPDNVVESGNARVLAIRRAYQTGNADRYRAWLQGQGFDTTGMNEPVLVRQRTTPLTPEARTQFTREANERTTAGMGTTEQASTDAAAMPTAMLYTYKGGNLAAAANRDFVRAFVDRVVPPSDRAAVYTREGGLSQEGMRRLENAVFQKAYGDSEILAALREDQDSNFKSIGNAMTDAAPAWAKMRSLAARGEIPPEMDITPALREAVGIVRQSRKLGQPVDDIMRQSDMFGGPARAETNDILRLLFSDEKLTRPASRQKVAGELRYYADQAMRAESGPSLLPGAQRTTPEDILTLARTKGQRGLLDELPAVAEARVPGTLSLDEANAHVGGELPETAAMQPGERYRGFHPQPYDPNVPTAERVQDVLRRETILHKLMAGLGVPLYQGRITGKGRLGFYRKGIEEVRVKKPSDIETTAHEIAHLLDDRIPEIRHQWLPATKDNAAIRDELRGVSYDKKKLFEGFAEFVRLWATQPEEAAARAPKFNAWFEDFLNRSPYGPTLRDMRQGMTQWFEQAALDRARSKIGLAEDINSGLSRMGDRFRQSVVDDLHGIYEAERSVTGKIAPGGAYETARLTRGNRAVVEGALTLGVPRTQPDGSVRFEGDGLEQVLSPVADSMDDFLMYAVGRSANELMRQGREHLFTRSEIKGMLALQRPEFDKTFDRYQEWNNGILDFAESKGLINRLQRQSWKRAEYLPFYRVGQPGEYSPVQGDWRGIKALTGGTDNLRDVLHNIIRNAATLIDASLTNEARVKVADLAAKPGGAAIMAKIPTEDRAVRIHPEEVRRAVLEALGVRNMHELDPGIQQTIDEIVKGMNPVATFLLKGQAPSGRNVVAVMRGGKPEYWEVADPILFRALTSLKRPTANWLQRVLSIPRRIGQTSVTLTMDFVAANIARDTIMGGIMSRHGFRPIIDSAIGMKSRLLRDQNYRDYIANGGGFSSYFLDPSNFRSHLERFYARKGINPHTVLDTPRKLLTAVEQIADAFEMSTRLGEYRQAIQRGENPRHAAYSAREVSTDFAMRGDSAALGFMYDTVMFLKAGVNGMDRLYRGIAHDPNRVGIAAKTALMAMASMALYGLNRNNPQYQDLEDWDKDAYWHFFIPRPGTDENTPPDERYIHFRYPKIWEIGAVASIAERTMGTLLDHQPDLGGHVLKILWNVENLGVLPQLVGPLYEVAANQNTFTGRPIETQAEQELQPWARAGVNTPQILREFGKAERHLPTWMQVSPADAEALLRGYFNTWATYGLTLSDALLTDSRPDMPVGRYPVIRRFYEQSPSPQTHWLTDLYNAISATTEARRTLTLMMKSGQEGIAHEIAPTPENMRYRQLTHANQQLRTYHTEIERVEEARTLTQAQALAKAIDQTSKSRIEATARQGGQWNDIGALKRVELDQITRNRNAFAKGVMHTAPLRGTR